MKSVGGFNPMIHSSRDLFGRASPKKVASQVLTHTHTHTYQTRLKVVSIQNYVTNSQKGVLVN